MDSSLLCLFFIQLFLLCIRLPNLNALGSTISGNETDRLALLSFKSMILEDHQGVLSSWNESFHFCKWQGVICGHLHERVTVINLASGRLLGSMSPYIGNLTFLRVLNLFNNTLQGEIPTELGRLFRLQVLNLNNNRFEGEIPANISHCSNLIYLGVGYNNLGGKIPEELGLLSKLTTLIFHVNNFIGGVPPFIGNLTSLVTISAAQNPLGGAIPDSLGQLKNLRQLGLGGTNLSGTIPSSMYNHSLLTILSLVSNQLHGSLPPSFGSSLSRLQFLQLGDNQFTGPLPVSLSNCSSLVKFEVGRNDFSGNIDVDFGVLQNITQITLFYNNLGGGGPSEMSFIDSMVNCSNLKVLGFEGNQFKGPLPNSLGNLSTNLFFLTLGANLIHGRLPFTIGNLVNLTVLGLDDNQLSGEIPSSIGNLLKLQRLALQINMFSGMIPDSLGNLTSLNELYLGSNKLEGTIPSRLGNCQNLLLLKLSDNNLTGNIPRQLFQISALSITLNLSRNHLSGPLPVEVGNLNNLAELDVSENDLSGEIPNSLRRCTSLQNLSLQGNYFQGSIPQSSPLSSLRGLKLLDLSRNNFSGQIPSYLGTFALQYLNLSFNSFEGELPKEGVFKNASAVFVEGNVKLCGGMPELKLPECKGSKRKRSTVAYKLVVPIVVGLLGLSLVFCLLSFCWLKKRRKDGPSESPTVSFSRMSYQTLDKATDGFSSANLIGMGAFGSVYSGNLEDGRRIAVKVFNLEHHGAAKSFIAECDTLRNIRHRNLVKVITACSSIDHQGNDFKAVVYELMANRSLEDWLHPARRIEEANEEPRRLNLFQRLKIAIDIATALDYLHNHCQPPIVHCDIKPNNILLDEEMTGHICDFGLARSLMEKTQNCYANQESSMGVKGSIGYTPPEYGLGNEISTNGDVYSFGILLLEMMTGKRPTDLMFDDGENLHNFARMALPDRVTDIMDPLILKNDEDVVASTAGGNKQTPKDARIMECLISIIRIGVTCSKPSPQDRMSIEDVVRDLHLLRGIL